MRSKNGEEIKYLYAIEDHAFSELSQLVENAMKTSGMSEDARSGIFQKIIGVAYDKDSSGDFLSIHYSPICPFCGDAHEKKYTETNPPEYEIINVQNATSISWDKLSNEKKMELVAAALAGEVSY